MTHYNLVHKFIPMPQAMRIPRAKAGVGKECKKLETIPAWDLGKVKSKILNEIGTVIQQLDCYGKTIRASFIRTFLGKSTELGMSIYLFTENKDYYRYTWRI